MKCKTELSIQVIRIYKKCSKNSEMEKKFRNEQGQHELSGQRKHEFASKIYLSIKEPFVRGFSNLDPKQILYSRLTKADGVTLELFENLERIGQSQTQSPENDLLFRLNPAHTKIKHKICRLSLENTIFFFQKYGKRSGFGVENLTLWGQMLGPELRALHFTTDLRSNPTLIFVVTN